MTPSDQNGDSEQPNAKKKVGYKSPPEEYRFKPGQSGNPKGPNKKDKTVGQIWTEVAQAKCEMVVGGKKKKMMRVEAVAVSVMAKALKGDLKAALTVLQAYGQHGPTSDVGSATQASADKSALEHFLAKLLAGGGTDDQC